MTIRSLRPPCINIKMVGNGAWSERVAKALREKMGAVVTCDLRPIANGNIQGTHVLIIESLVDPGFKFVKNLREKWSERELPVIVVDDNDHYEVDAMQAGANAFIDRSFHADTGLLEKLVYGLAYEG
jgi:DNA-binding NarL/FixJ family response regulator